MHTEFLALLTLRKEGDKKDGGFIRPQRPAASLGRGYWAGETNGLTQYETALYLLEDIYKGRGRCLASKRSQVQSPAPSVKGSHEGNMKA